MIIITAPETSAGALSRIIERVEAAGLRTHVPRGEHRTIVGCIGDEDLRSDHGLTQLEGVERVLPVLKPFKLASREFSVQSTAILSGRRGPHRERRTRSGGDRRSVLAWKAAI